MTTSTALKDPRWLAAFKLLHGLEEKPGAPSNPVILHWVQDIGAPGWYDNDDKPWCALAMNRVMLASDLPLAGSGFDLLRARSFEHWGVNLDVPAYGCVMVFERPEGAHVGLYLGERKDAYRIYGANQSNTVGAAWIPKKRLTATRWPADVELTQVGRIWMLVDGSPASINEA